MEDVIKLVKEGLEEIGIPDPELDTAVRKQLKDVGDLVSCLFKQMIDELGDFIKGMLSDLLENVLDTALCLVQNFSEYEAVDGHDTECIRYVERCYWFYQRCKR